MDKLRKIRFAEREYWLVGTTDGPVVVNPEDYEHGFVSYAHLQPDGRLMRYHRCLGAGDEIQFTDEYREAHVDLVDSMVNLIDGRAGGWPEW